MELKDIITISREVYTNRKPVQVKASTGATGPEKYRTIPIHPAVKGWKTIDAEIAGRILLVCRMLGGSPAYREEMNEVKLSSLIDFCWVVGR